MMTEQFVEQTANLKAIENEIRNRFFMAVVAKKGL